MKFAHISDIHFFDPRFDSYKDFFSKKPLALLNHYLRREWGEIQEKQLNSLLPILQSSKPNYILISGDFTTKATHYEYLLAKNYIDKLSSIAPCLTLPGNHDIYTQSDLKENRFYHYFPETLAFKELHLKEHGVGAKHLFEDWYLVVLDASYPMPLWSSEGLFSEKKELELHKLLNHLPQDAKIIFMNHYPVLDKDRLKKHRMRRSKQLREIIKQEPRIKIYLYGHTHKQTITHPSPIYPRMINPGSLTQGKQQSFHIMELSSEELIIQPYFWENSSWTMTEPKSFAGL